MSHCAMSSTVTLPSIDADSALSPPTMSLPLISPCTSLSHGTMSLPAMSSLATSPIAMFHSVQPHPTMPPSMSLEIPWQHPSPSMIHSHHLATDPIFLDGVLRLCELDFCPNFELIYFSKLFSTHSFFQWIEKIGHDMASWNNSLQLIIPNNQIWPSFVF